MALIEIADHNTRLRFSVSLVRQGRHQFYTLTMPSDVLARTCKVTTRREDPQKGFQRVLDEKRAAEIARYVDAGLGTIPNSIILSAQPEAELRIIGRGKTLEFSDRPGAFLVLDGQHRVFGFAKAKTPLRVPVVIYNGLSRSEESRLFIDINTKQRPVPAELLLDIKRTAEIEDASEIKLREVFDLFNARSDSALRGLMAPFEKSTGKITRVTFNSAVKALLESFSDRTSDQIYSILNAYLIAFTENLSIKTSEPVIGKPVVFRAIVGLFPAIAQRVQDKFSGIYTSENFSEVLQPLFSHLPMRRVTHPGSSWVELRDYFAARLREKMSF